MRRRRSIVRENTCGDAATRRRSSTRQRNRESRGSIAPAARDPLRGIRARLLIAEAGRRRGRRSAVAGLLARFDKLAASSLPPIVRARCALFKDLVAAASAPDEIVARHVASTRLEALALFVPVQARGASYGGAADPLLDDVVDILHL